MHPARRHVPSAGTAPARTFEPIGPALPARLLAALLLVAKPDPELLDRNHCTAPARASLPHANQAIAIPLSKLHIHPCDKLRSGADSGAPGFYERRRRDVHNPGDPLKYTVRSSTARRQAT
jgi:hypothetical protein